MSVHDSQRPVPTTAASEPVASVDALASIAPLELSALKDRALAATAEGVTIADARLPDRPIIYANDSFERLTGYTVEETLGRNCRFLQGPETDPATVDEIRTALREHQPCTVEILNYRHDGTPFWNRLSITPVRDAADAVTHYIGVQSDITEQKAAAEALLRTKIDLERAYGRMRRNLETAADIQRALLPEHSPTCADVRFHSVFRPCEELAGDTLNIIRLDPRHYGIYLIDVSGHGVPAALFSVALGHWLAPTPGQSFLFSRADSESDERYTIAPPVEVATRLNRKFPMNRRTNQYFTMLYGVLDRETRVLRWVTAGHPPPILVPHEGDARVLAGTGFPVGIMREPDYDERRVQLAPGDRVYWYTDGITELTNDDGRELGIQRLMACLDENRDVSLAQSMETAMARAEAWCQCRVLDDDASMLAFEIPPA